jgi:hypothetical protein
MSLTIIVISFGMFCEGKGGIAFLKYSRIYTLGSSGNLTMRIDAAEFSHWTGFFISKAICTLMATVWPFANVSI